MARAARTTARATERRPVGRPARISRSMIAEAALDLGLDGLTLKAVAEHLGVSIAALYHHVAGKDDLVRLVAEHSVARVPRPVDRGQHWAVWLHEWGTYNREAFVSQPGLLAQYLDGVIEPAAIAGSIETILGVLVREGFSILEANAAYELVSACALGAAIAVLRERHAPTTGETLGTAARGLLARHRPDELPHLRALMREVRTSGRRPFADQLTTVLRGIAAERGARWAPIAAQLEAAAHRPATG